MKFTERICLRAVRRALAGTLIAAACAVSAAPGALAAPASAVVFMYHRFGEPSYAATNIRIDQFEAHLKELADKNFNVMPLDRIVAALQANRSLPERTVAITIDDAFLSVYTQAWPRLRAANLPFTLFVSTDVIDQKRRGYMSWDQIRELAAAGVTIGGQTGSHLHMPSATRKRNVSELSRSNARLKKELGRAPTLLAYPYGEYAEALLKPVRGAGYVAAFGQHSGVVHPKANFFFLPRFAMNETYGDIGRFRLAANALPLAVSEITPADPKLTQQNNPPPFGFTVVDKSIVSLASLACYASGQGKARIERLGRRRIEVRMSRAFPPGRARINCTMPAGNGRWRWFGIQFFVPKS